MEKAFPLDMENFRSFKPKRLAKWKAPEEKPFTITPSKNGRFSECLFYKRNIKLSFLVSIVTVTLVKVWENSKQLWKLLPPAGVSTAFLVLPSSVHNYE